MFNKHFTVFLLFLENDQFYYSDLFISLTHPPPSTPHPPPPQNNDQKTKLNQALRRSYLWYISMPLSMQEGSNVYSCLHNAMSALVVCALCSGHKKKNWLKIVITWVTQNLINFTRRTEWFTDILWPPFLLQHRRVAPNHMTWGHTDGGERWRPLLAGLPSLTWWDNWRLGFLDWWSITGSAGWMGQRSICGGHLWNRTVSRSAIQSGKEKKENIRINFIHTSMI